MLRFLEKAVSLAAALALAGLLAPSAARASVARPSYARPLHEQRISGIITSFNGRYSMQIHDSRGYFDDVKLHQGTIINPTGLTLKPGMKVTIYGHPQNGQFLANEIDTPYHLAYVYPPPAYYWGPYWGPAYWGPGWFWWR
jgi:hypothetical protein